MGFEDSNSDPPVCATVVLFPEPAPQPFTDNFELY